MIYRKKIPKTRKIPLTELEEEIISFLIISLHEPYKSKLKGQMPYLPRRKRIPYPKSVITEFYPEKGNPIPDEILFSRDEEFRLGNVKFKINEERFFAKFHMVLGSFFDISIKPKPPKKIDIEEVEFGEVKVEENLERNVY